MFAFTKRRRIAATIAALGAATLVAGCSSGDDTTAAGTESGGPSPSRSRTRSAPPPSTPRPSGSSPSLERRGHRVRLGGTPVGMPKNSYGADANGVMPWLSDKFDASRTTLLDTRHVDADRSDRHARTGCDPRALRGLRPGHLRPTVRARAHRRVPRQGVADDMAGPDHHRRSGDGQVRRAHGADDRRHGQDARRHRRRASRVRRQDPLGDHLDTTNGQVNVYKPTDPRVQVLTELGFVNSPGVEKIAAESDPDSFFASISAERINEVDADVVIAFVPDQAEAAKNPATTRSVPSSGAAPCRCPTPRSWPA